MSDNIKCFICDTKLDALGELIAKTHPNIKLLCCVCMSLMIHEDKCSSSRVSVYRCIRCHVKLCGMHKSALKFKQKNVHNIHYNDKTINEVNNFTQILAKLFFRV